MFQIGDWVDLGEGWVQLRKVTYSMPSNPKRDAIVYLNDYGCEWVWDWLDKSKHRSVDGPFRAGDIVFCNRHTNRKLQVRWTYQSSDPGNGWRLTADVLGAGLDESVRHVDSFVGDFKLAKPVEAIYQEKLAEGMTEAEIDMLFLFGTKAGEVPEKKRHDLNEAVDLIEHKIAPEMVMGTDAWVALTNVWMTLLNETGQDARLIHGKEYTKSDFAPYLNVLTEDECKRILTAVCHAYARGIEMTPDEILSVINKLRDASDFGFQSAHMDLFLEILKSGYKKANSDAKE